jgi:rhamnosyltransferase
MLHEARIVVPIRNGGARWREAAVALRAAVPEPAVVVIVDSSSTDGSDRVAAEQGFEVHRIDVRNFNHGRTRQEAVERFCQDKRFVIFLTQDAVVDSAATLPTLLSAFGEQRVGAAYGRQLPHHDSGAFGAHAALFNYGETSEMRALADARHRGIKTAYLSNSFAAYRITALMECGGFPDHLILGEDAYVAMKMLMSGWLVSYRAEARVRHSHDYTVMQEAQRYFDFGVMHAQIPELLERFGAPEGEGARFVTSELRHMRKVAPWLLPEVMIRNFMKYAGYRLGRWYARVPPGMRRRLSMTKGYWDTPGPAGPGDRAGRPGAAGRSPVDGPRS